MTDPLAACGTPLAWHGCYSGSYDLWTPESYAHPAKMSVGLAFRVLVHLEELGLLCPSDTVLDPMAGIATSLLVAAAKNYPSIGVELEERFVSMAQANAVRLAAKGFKSPINIIQGDARQLSSLLAERGLVAVTSPPYSEAQSGGGIAQKGYQGPKHGLTDLVGKRTYMPENIGSTPGQIGVLPDKPLKAITSPPYAGHISQSDSDLHPDRQESKPAGRRYPETEGQIADLPDRPLKAVTSPPYEDSDVDGARKMAEGYFDQVGGVGHTKTIPTAQMGKGESYLSAMRQVYAEIALCCDCLCLVLKDPTRNGKIRPLGYDTWKLLEATGWTVVDYHRAILFSETQQVDLLGNTHKKLKGRISFFKRIGIAKGIPSSNFEHVIIAARGSGVSSMIGIGERPALTAECALPTVQPGA